MNHLPADNSHEIPSLIIPKDKYRTKQNVFCCVFDWLSVKQGIMTATCWRFSSDIVIDRKHFFTTDLSDLSIVGTCDIFVYQMRHRVM